MYILNMALSLRDSLNVWLKKYHSLKTDYNAWLDEIYKNPLVGDDLGGGIRKIRMAIADKGKGKSGGARILTLNVKVSEDGMNVTLLENEEQEITKYRDETLYTHEISLISNIIALRIYIQE